MFDHITSWAVDEAADGAHRLVAVSCGEERAEMRTVIRGLLDAMAAISSHLPVVSSTDSALIKRAKELAEVECGEFFLVDKLTWTNAGRPVHLDETVMCVLPEGHKGTPHTSKEGWVDRRGVVT
jgi:hypothetical protein